MTVWGLAVREILQELRSLPGFLLAQVEESLKLDAVEAG